MTVVAASHIVIDKRGTPRIAGTRSSVANIVIDTRNGLSPEDIHREYPHLSLAQVHAALAYYYDHKAEIDASIEQDDREFKIAYEAAVKAGQVPSREELRRRLQEKLDKQEKSL